MLLLTPEEVIAANRAKLGPTAPSEGAVGRHTTQELSPALSWTLPIEEPATAPEPAKGPAVHEVVGTGPRALKVTPAWEVLLKCDNAFDFMQLCFPDIEPYRWQIECLLQLSGYPNPYDERVRFEPTVKTPLLYTLNAANGSGKDQIVLAVWALYCVCCKRNFHWIGTSSSYVQLHEQTWRHIVSRAKEINRQFGARFLDIKKHKIVATKLNSEITLYRTDEGGKVEGWHPIVENGPMAIILNECKSLELELVMSFKKCHGYTHWVNISSPGDPIGYFYDRCTEFASTWPKPIIPGQPYYRHITWADCPHLAHEYARDVEEFGIESPYIQSSYLANFISLNQLYIIPAERLKYAYPAKSTLGLPKRAGLDLSGGGDATVLSVWEGNYHIREYEFHERHEPTLTRMLCAQIADLQISPSQVYADAGGMGTAIIQRMAEAGCPINGVHNEHAPRNRRVYKNRGAETAFNFRRLVLDKILNLDNLSAKLKRQMTSRLYTLDDGRIFLEEKKKFRARCGYSPDHFDAAILAHVGCNYYVFKAANAEIAEAAESKSLTNTWQQDWNEIYGDLDNNTARGAGLYRTSGIFGRRNIGGALQSFARQMGRGFRSH